MSTDWFKEAAKAASKTEHAREMRRATAERESSSRAAELKAKREALSRRRDPRAVAAASSEFGIPTVIPPEPVRQKPPTPDEALAVIEELVMKSKNPVEAAGEWIGKITNALSSIANDHLDDTQEHM